MAGYLFSGFFRQVKAIVGLCLLLTSSAIAESGTIKIAAGNVDGTTYSLAYEICKDLEKQYNDLTCHVSKSSGSISTIEKLIDGKADIAITQEDVLYDSVTGKNRLKDHPGALELRYVLRLYREGMIIAVPEKSDIFSLEDLKNRVVSVGNREAGACRVLQRLFHNAGITHDQMPINKGNLTPTRKIRSFFKGDLEAIIFLSGNPNPIVSEILQRGNVRVIDIPEKYFKPEMMNNPYYFPIYYPKDTYRDLAEDVTTLGVHTALVTSTQTPQDIVDKVYNSLTSKFEAYQKAVPVLSRIKKQEIYKSVEEVPHYYKD
jgi:TRAP transporter TAXI family solute receptor